MIVNMIVWVVHPMGSVTVKFVPDFKVSSSFSVFSSCGADLLGSCSSSELLPNGSSCSSEPSISTCLLFLSKIALCPLASLVSIIFLAGGRCAPGPNVGLGGSVTVDVKSVDDVSGGPTKPHNSVSIDGGGGTGSAGSSGVLFK